MIKEPCHNWLTIVGPVRTVTRFVNNADWERALQARQVDWLELSPGHHVCEFHTTGRPLVKLERLSRRWPSLILLLEYECGRSMGLVKARRGLLDGCELSY